MYDIYRQLSIKAIKKTTRWLAFISAFILNISFSTAQQPYYVDPENGSDFNHGRSIENAFKTLYKARNIIRGINQNMTDNIIVYLRGGTYLLDSTLDFSEKDGGKNGHNIIYQPYNCETPIISGGIKLSEWILHDREKNIYKTIIEKGINPRQLYVNGNRAIRARSVDASGWQENGNGYDCPEDVAAWKNISSIEVVSRMIWKCHRGHVSSVEGNHVRMAEPYWTNLHQQYYAPPVWIENAYELLDSEDEWYLDASANTLYYIPKKGEILETAEVYLPKIETLVRFKNLSNLEIRGVIFSHATWSGPSSDEGFPCHQADQMLSNTNWRDFKQMPGNIIMDHCTNVNIVSCSFQHLGSTALQLDAGCKSNVIYNNSFIDVSGSGISIGPLNDSLPTVFDAVSDNTITNNLISNVAVEFQSCVGILVGYTLGTKITHNEIRNLPYTGISIGWGWSNTETIAANNEIAYNLIDSVMTVLIDGGAIYALSTQRGTQIHHNYITNELNEHAALYADEGSSYIRFHHNVLDNVFRWIYLWSTTSLNDTINFNYYNNNENIISGTDCIVMNNEHVLNNQWPSEAVRIMKKAGRLLTTDCTYAFPIDTINVVKLYPVPTSGILHIMIQKWITEPYKVEIFDMSGRLMKISREIENILSLELTDLPSGLYFIRISIGKDIYQNKVIKL